MTISVVVVAHNEELYIRRCLESLLSQSRKADEIIVVNHNSTDSTGTLARPYPVRVVDYAGPAGPVYARIKGFEEAVGDVILCIDGDSCADTDWIATLYSLLEKDSGVRVVGSWVRMTGVLLAHVASLRWYFFCNTEGKRATDYLYGASYGIRGSDRYLAIKALRQGLALSESLNLAYNPDDYWLALFMSQTGNVTVTNRTWVIAHAKEMSSWAFIKRSLVASGIRSRIHKYLRTHRLPHPNAL